MKNHQSKQRRTQKDWSKLDEVIYEAQEIVITNQVKVHAIYEACERKRNALLGLPPTLSQIAETISNELPRPDKKINPEQQTLDAKSLNLTQSEIEARTPNK
jgi:hypothetical protein